MNYFKILLFLEKGNRDIFTYPKIEQTTFLNSLGEAKDDIDRGYKQYLCQKQLVLPKWKRVLFNIVGVLAFPFVAIYFLTKRLFTKKSNRLDCLIEKKGMPEVVPLEVRKKYQPTEAYGEGTSLGLSDLGFIWKMICRAPFQPYFVFKAMMNVVRYSHLIYKYSPQSIIQFNEFSFSSSILTAYCHRFGIKNIDVMHGEKLFFIRDAYFHYDEIYVWHQHYVDLLKSLKAEPTQFRIALPPSMHIDSNKYHNPKAYADYKYYLAIFDEEKIRSIVESLAFVKKNGKSVKYRPHPRYSDVDLLKKYVAEDEIENPKAVSIQESVANLGCAVGSYTTVMVQAYFSGKQVMMDDVTFLSQYEKMKDLDYFLSAVNVPRLSAYQ